jgi:hypothetical protein
MARLRVLQNSLITGVIAPTLLGRVDLEKYYNAVEEAENVVIMPHGGVERRSGLKYLTSVTTGSRLFSFEFSISQNYVVVLSTTDIKIYKPNDDTLYATLDYTDNGLSDITTTQLNEMDIIQSADTIIITHEDFYPRQIQRQGSDTSWDLDTIPLTNIPKFDFDTTKTPIYFNYGSSITFDIDPDEIVYNNDGNNNYGTNKYLYKALKFSQNTDLSAVDYTKTSADYTNTGSSQTVTINKGDVVLNLDGNSVAGLNNHAYIAVRDIGSIDISTPNYYSTPNDWMDNGLWDSLGEREDVWSATRGYPRTCTFHQGRLWFGGSKAKPTSVWASVVNDFFDFDTGSDDVQADDAIFDVLDTDNFNAIQNIVSGSKLQVLTAGGEFVNTEDIITPTSSSWVRYTGYGAARVKPVTLDGSTYFMDRFKKTVRGFIYDWEEGGYTTPPVSILAEHIINDVQDLDIVRGSSISVSNLLYLVNADGTVAVFNTMRKENISGWTKWTTTGNFKRVTVTGDVVTFIVERDGTEYLEVLDDTVLLDHTFKTTSADKVEVDQVLLDNEIRVVGESITQTTIAAVDESGTYYAYADAIVDEIYAGLNYTVKIKTLPVAANTQAEGNIVHLPKRITRCILQLYNARGIYVDNNLVTNRKFGDATDEVFTPITGIESIYLLGYNSKAQVEITQKNPDPMTLLSLDLEVSY